MADNVIYCNAGDQSTTGHYAVAKRPQNTAVAAGALRRQFTAPAVGNERVFACVVAGTTANVTDATWVLTNGAKTTDGTVTWMECTGKPAVNGDATNTAVWAASTAAALGGIVKRVNGASYWICTTAGNSGASEPAWPSDTAGATRTDNTITWTCLGVVGNFTGGQAPHARLATAFSLNALTANNNVVYVGNNHAESQATAISISSTLNNPYYINKVICHNSSGSYPPAAGDIATGATISTTAAVAITFSVTTGGTIPGVAYIYGLTFAVGTGGSGANLNLAAAGTLLFCDSCVFKENNTAAFNAVITLTGAVVWNNCQVYFGAAGVSVAQYIDVGNCNFTWQNTGTVLASGSTVPQALFGNASGSRNSTITLDALDLSQISTRLFGSGTITSSAGTWVLKDCKLHASVAVSVSDLGGSGTTIQLIRCDSGATAYKSARYSFEGSEVTETSITRVGGALDTAGQAQSRKIVTAPNISGQPVSQWARPFKAEPYAAWNAVTGANVTVTVYGTINAAALPLNDDIWMEVEYLSSASFPTGKVVHTSKASVLATGAAVASDASAWNGGGSGAGWKPFKLVAVLSSPQPGMAGYIHARVRAAKPTTTYYIDPLLVLT